MKNKIFLVSTFLFFLLPSVSATCLTTQQVASLNTLLDVNNMTATDKDAIFAIFDTLCDRSYTKNETDAKFEDFRTINETVRIYMDNYTEWFEEKESIGNYMRAIAEVLNATSDLDGISRQTDGKISIMEDQFDDKLNNLKDMITGYATADDMRLLEQNVSIRMTASENNLRKEFVNQQQGNTGFIIFAIIIVALGAGYMIMKRMEGNKIKEAYQSAPPVHRRRGREGVAEEIIDDDVREAIEEKRRKQIEEESELVKRDAEQENAKDDMRSKLKRQLGGK